MMKIKTAILSPFAIRFALANCLFAALFAGSNTALLAQQAGGQPVRDSNRQNAQRHFESPPVNMLTPAAPSRNGQQPQGNRTLQVVVPGTQNDANAEIRVSHLPESESNSSDNDPLKEKLKGEKTDQESTHALASFTQIQDSKPVLKVAGGLCVVIAIFFGFTLFARKNGARVNGKIPEEVFQVVGQMPLDSKRQFQLVRLGSKLLLLTVSDKNIQSVGEIEDPIEVEHVLSMLQKGQAAEAFSSFRRTTSQIRQQRRAMRMYPSQANPDAEYSEPHARLGSSNVFEA